MGRIITLRKAKRSGAHDQRSMTLGVDELMPELSDIDLLEAFKAGDAQAFEELVLRHRQLCYSFIYRMVGRPEATEDLYQDTWLKVLKNAHTYKPKAKFTTWVLQIARNTVLDYFKRESLRRHPSIDQRVGDGEQEMSALLASDTAMPEDVLSSEEAIEEVQRAMRELPVKHQEVLMMRTYHKLSYAEIGKIVGAPEGTVKYWVHEAVKSLGGILEQRGLA